MNELALFSGAGGGLLASELLGWRTVAAVENDAFCCRRVMQRQNEKHLPPFPIWDDVCTFDGHPWRGIVDVVSGGFPCQDISIAGKGDGLDGKRSGLWRHMRRIIGEVVPAFVFVENSPALVVRGLGSVLGDLASMGYDARWGNIGADDAGFSIHRKRIWILGIARRPGLEGFSRHVTGAREWAQSFGSAPPAGVRRAGWKRVVYAADCDDDGFCPQCGNDFGDCGCPGPTLDECQYGELGGVLYGRSLIRFVEPGLGRVAYGVAHRMDRIRAIGNGQVPDVARLAWQILGGPPTR